MYLIGISRLSTRVRAGEDLAYKLALPFSYNEPIGVPMIRIAVIVSAVVLAACVAACDVGSAASIAQNGADGGSGGTDGGSSTSDSGVQAAAAHDHCLSGVGQTGCQNTNNPSNAGQDCGQAACHGSGGAGGTFEFMGTVCAGSPCTKPAQGITVTFGSATATTDQDGNFYIAGTPITGSSTSTQGGYEMTSPTPTSDCNGSGTCHQANSSQTFPVGGSGSGTEGSIYN
jgi:hypothetical protein